MEINMEEVIKAIHCDEIEELFQKLGILGRLINGELKCHVCGGVITKQNFRALSKKSDELIFCCDNDDCYEKFV